MSCAEGFLVRRFELAFEPLLARELFFAAAAAAAAGLAVLAVVLAAVFDAVFNAILEVLRGRVLSMSGLSKGSCGHSKSAQPVVLWL